jgi:aminoglycoside phosphotransferase (APT) family kinase protein
VEFIDNPLDIESPEQLIQWLRTSSLVQADETPAVHILKGGVSNRTVLVERAGGEAWVLKQALPRLRVAVDWFSSPQRIHQEALGMRCLATLAPPGAITPMIFEDVRHHVIVMQAVPQPHQNWKALLMAGTIEPEHVREFATLLASIHRRARREQTTLKEVFANTTYFENLRLEPFYQYSAAQFPEAADSLNQLVNETRTIRETLVHGDFSPKNILVRENRMVLLDHEVIHWGDPMFDVGFALAHLFSKAHHLPDSREILCREAIRFWDAYQQKAGDFLARPDNQKRAVRHTLGCLMARAIGRSQVEYLSHRDKLRQRDRVAAILPHPPEYISDLAGELNQAFTDS